MSFPVLPTSLPAGHVPTATEYQSILDYVTAITPTIRVKSTDQSVTSSTTLVNDNDLFFTPAVSTVWVVQLNLIYEASTTGDAKWGFTFPTGAFFSWGHTVINTSLGADATSVFSYLRAASGNAFSAGGDGAGNRLHAVLGGTLTMGSTSGNLQFQFAQQTSDGTATKINQDSFMIAWRVS